MVLWADLFHDLKPISHSSLTVNTLLPQHLTLYLLNVGSLQQNFPNIFQEQKGGRMLANSLRYTEAGEMCCAMVLHWLDSEGLHSRHRHIMQEKGLTKRSHLSQPGERVAKHQTRKVLESHHQRFVNRVQTSSEIGSCLQSSAINHDKPMLRNPI